MRERPARDGRMGGMTTVAIIGAHGKVGQQVMRLLYDRGDDFLGVVRGEEQADDVVRFGGRGILLDIETATAESLAVAIADADAVVFTAGAGGESGIERKRSVDLGGSILAQEAARMAGIRRFVQISAIGVDEPLDEDTDPQWAAYVEAKRDADVALRATELDWTILRPGGLTSDDGTGHVDLAEHVERGSIPRQDVAALVLACLDDDRTVRRQWEAVSGARTIAEAIDATVGGAA